MTFSITRHSGLRSLAKRPVQRMLKGCPCSRFRRVGTERIGITEAQYIVHGMALSNRLMGSDCHCNIDETVFLMDCHGLP